MATRPYNKDVMSKMEVVDNAMLRTISELASIDIRDDITLGLCHQIEELIRLTEAEHRKKAAEMRRLNIIESD